MNTRRTFLKTLGATGLVALGTRPHPVFARATRPNLDGRILVLVQLAGGNDGLNTVVPFEEDNYRKLRPSLGIGKSAALKLEGALGLHPQMQGFKELFDDGALGIVQGVGYPNPNRSHFRSMDISVSYTHLTLPTKA